ncbi:MAG: glycosyltransferase family 2 protein [Chloroflexota bacterium]|nr:glycosyltransferase family 2 protein [Chloroflexota bacterium]
MPSLSLFFPCYNDAGTIGSLVTVADAVAREYTDDYEIIVVDDASNDNSRELLTELRARYPRLRLVFHETNRGYGGALCSGFSHATKDLVFYTDGDGQYDVFELRRLLPVMQEGVDVINGYKIERNDPLHRIIIGRVYVVLMRMMFLFKVRDVDCDFRLFRRGVLDGIRLQHRSGVICLEFVKKLERAGFRFVDFPVHHYHRVYGRSQFFNFKRLAVTAANIFKLWVELMVLQRSPARIAHRSPAEVDRYLTNGSLAVDGHVAATTAGG